MEKCNTRVEAYQDNIRKRKFIMRRVFHAEQELRSCQFKLRLTFSFLSKILSIFSEKFHMLIMNQFRKRQKLQPPPQLKSEKSVYQYFTTVFFSANHNGKHIFSAKRLDEIRFGSFQETKNYFGQEIVRSFAKNH